MENVKTDKVKIVIKSRMEKGEEIREEYQGNMTVIGESVLLDYNENKGSTLNNTRTQIKIEKDYMVVERAGDFSSIMEFKKGESSTSDYETPYGKMKLRFKTLEYKRSLNGDLGGIRNLLVTLNYISYIEGKVNDTVTMKILVRV